MRNILRFAFTVSLITTLVLAFIEWQVPGFVSFVFPFYWLVVASIVLGALSGALPPPYQGGAGGGQNFRAAALVLCALALALIVLEDGGVFGVMRIPLAIVIVVSSIALVRSHPEQK